jgi:hypothetical protein
VNAAMNLLFPYSRGAFVEYLNTYKARLPRSVRGG